MKQNVDEQNVDKKNSSLTKINGRTYYINNNAGLIIFRDTECRGIESRVSEATEQSKQANKKAQPVQKPLNTISRQ